MKRIGFTIIEILVALAVLGGASLIIGTFVVNNYKISQKTSNMSDINDLTQKINLLFADGALCKSTLNKLMSFQPIKKMDTITNSRLQVWDTTGTPTLILKDGSPTPLKNWQLKAGSMTLSHESQKTGCGNSTINPKLHLMSFKYAVEESNDPNNAVSTTTKNYEILVKVGTTETTPGIETIVACGASVTFCNVNSAVSADFTASLPSDNPINFDRPAGANPNQGRIETDAEVAAYTPSIVNTLVNAGPVNLNLTDTSTGIITTRKWKVKQILAPPAPESNAMIPETFATSGTDPTHTQALSTSGIWGVQLSVEDQWGDFDVVEKRFTLTGGDPKAQFEVTTVNPTLTTPPPSPREWIAFDSDPNKSFWTSVGKDSFTKQLNLVKGSNVKLYFTDKSENSSRIDWSLSRWNGTTSYGPNLIQNPTVSPFVFDPSSNNYTAGFYRIQLTAYSSRSRGRTLRNTLGDRGNDSNPALVQKFFIRLVNGPNASFTVTGYGEATGEHAYTWYDFTDASTFDFDSAGTNSGLSSEYNRKWKWEIFKERPYTPANLAYSFQFVSKTSDVRSSDHSVLYTTNSPYINNGGAGNHFNYALANIAGGDLRCKYFTRLTVSDVFGTSSQTRLVQIPNLGYTAPTLERPVACNAWEARFTTDTNGATRALNSCNTFHTTYCSGRNKALWTFDSEVLHVMNGATKTQSINVPIKGYYKAHVLHLTGWLSQYGCQNNENLDVYLGGTYLGAVNDSGNCPSAERNKDKFTTRTNLSSAGVLLDKGAQNLSVTSTGGSNSAGISALCLVYLRPAANGGCRE